MLEVFPKYDRPFYFHSREYAGISGITICAIPVGEESFNCGISICNSIDNFNKKLGRTISEGRARCPRSCINILAPNFEILKDEIGTFADEVLEYNQSLRKRCKT